MGRGWRRLRRESRERELHQRESRHLALHDTLTGLPDRTLFLDRLGRAPALAQRCRQHTAVLFLDLADFKRVNDSYGHPGGDALPAAVAERLRGCLRLGDTAARLSGDERTILPENIRDEADAMHVAERVVQALASPFVLPGVTVRTSTSVGVAFAGPDARDPALLINQADSAFTKPKASGNRAAGLQRGPRRERIVPSHS